jgi:hypothetical protein
MTVVNHKLWLRLAPLALLGAGVALAAGTSPGDTGVDLRRASELSPADTVKEARTYKVKMGDTKARIDKLLDRARKQKDVIKINCLGDKSTQVKGHIAVADQSMASLDTAISRSDDGARQHEFMRLSILYQKVVVLGTEAENCIGEDVTYVGETKVDVEVDPSIPSGDPTEPLLPLPDVERPPEATPFV